MKKLSHHWARYVISIGQTSEVSRTYQISWGLSLQPWFSLHNSPYLLLHYPSFGPLWNTHYRCQSNLVSTIDYKYIIYPVMSQEAAQISFKMLIVLTCVDMIQHLNLSSAHAQKYNINSIHIVMQEIYDTSFPLEFGMDPEESLSEHLLSLCGNSQQSCWHHYKYSRTDFSLIPDLYNNETPV